MEEWIIAGIVVIALIVIIYHIRDTYMCAQNTTSRYNGRVVSRAEGEPTPGVGEQQAATPIVMKSNEGYSSDGLAPGAQAYQRLANEVFAEDLQTQINRKMADGLKRPMPEPYGDQFRWTGDFTQGNTDPYLNSPMYKKATGKGGNDGISLWEHNGPLER